MFFAAGMGLDVHELGEKEVVLLGVIRYKRRLINVGCYLDMGA